MCAMSVVYDYMQQRVPLDDWTRPAYDEFKQVIERLDRLDHLLGQPDCVDPEKAALMQRIEERLNRLEERVADPKKERR